MKNYSKKDIIKSLKKLGLKKGETIYINAHLYKFGNLIHVKNKKNFYKIFYESIQNIIGKNGTIAVNTHTFQVLRNNKTFIYEKTRSTSGEFPEFIRNKKGSLRSDHPVFSVTALGKKKKILCSNNSLHNYGNNSPYHRFLKLNGKILNLGEDPTFNPFLHVAEFLAGVPYFYNKLTKVKYFKNKKKIDKYFSSTVRYLNHNIIWKEPIIKSLKNKLIKNKVFKTVNLGEGKIYLINAKQFTETALSLLTKNPFEFIKSPRFKKNILPYK